MLKNIITIITGLPGVGKSFTVFKRFVNKLFLYLAFNRDLRKHHYDLNRYYVSENDKENDPETYYQELQHNNFLYNSMIHTIHSLCFNVLCALKLLPTPIMDLQPKDFEEKQELLHKYFDELISRFIKLDNNLIKSILPIYEVLIVDEYQDLRSDYIEVIQKLGKIFECPIAIAGDPFQKIYAFRNKFSDFKIEDNFTLIRKHFPDYDIETINLTHNFRAQVYLRRFINGMLTTSFPDLDISILYSNADDEPMGSDKKPQVMFFTNRDAEKAFIEKVIDDNPDSSIAILSRWNRDIEMLYDLDYDESLVTVSTIHKFKGKEADIVFLVGFSESDFVYSQDQMDELYVVYTAISRPCKQLFLTTSSPRFDFSKYFKEGTYEVVSDQEFFENYYNELPLIELESEYEYEKLSQSLIDSLILAVRAEDAPFLKYIPNDAPRKKNSPYIKETTREYEGIKFGLSFHNAHKIIYFKFLDLTLLHKNSFSDMELLQFCLNAIQDYFDYRIPEEAIYVQRLDLCRYFVFDSEKDVKDHVFWVREALMSWQINSSRGLYINQNSHTPLLHSVLEPDCYKSQTVYLNCHKDKYNGIVIKNYFPSMKVNPNRIDIDLLFKEEISIRGRILGSKAIMNGNRSVRHLLEMITNGELIEIYYDIFKKHLNTEWLEMLSPRCNSEDETNTCA